MKLSGVLKSLDVAIADTKRVYGLINDNFEMIKKVLQNRLSFRDNMYCDIVTGTFNSGAPRACKLINLSRAAGAIVVGSSVPCIGTPTVVSSDGYAMVTMFFAGMATNVTATVILIEVGSAPLNSQTVLAGKGRPGIVSPDGATITITPAGVITSTGGVAPYYVSYFRSIVATGQLIASGAQTIINFDSVEIDTAATVTTGAAWHFTAPKAGVYEVESTVLIVPTSADITSILLGVFKNGVEARRPYFFTIANPSTRFANGTGAGLSCKVTCALGDTLDIRITQVNDGIHTYPTNTRAPYVYVSIYGPIPTT